QTIGRVVAQRTNICFFIGLNPHCFDRNKFTPYVTNGDGTVPERSANRKSSLDPKIISPPVDLNAPGAHLWYSLSQNDDQDKLVEHTALTQLGQVHNRVLFILGKGPDPGADELAQRARPSPRNQSSESSNLTST